MRPPKTILVFGTKDTGLWETMSYPGRMPDKVMDIAREAAGLDDDHDLRIVGGYVSALVFNPSLDGQQAAAAAGAISEELAAQQINFVPVPRQTVSEPPLWSVPVLLQKQR